VTPDLCPQAGGCKGWFCNGVMRPAQGCARCIKLVTFQQLGSKVPVQQAVQRPVQTAVHTHWGIIRRKGFD